MKSMTLYEADLSQRSMAASDAARIGMLAIRYMWWGSDVDSAVAFARIAAHVAFRAYPELRG